MSDSETLHSIKYQNSKGENLLDNENNKKLTSDTEYYFNLIANPSKMIKNKPILNQIGLFLTDELRTTFGFKFLFRCIVKLW